MKLIDLFILTSPITFIFAMLGVPWVFTLLGFDGATGYCVGMGGFVVIGFIIATIDVVKRTRQDN